jgi:alkylation response protein AidB-like acyl-CoA dehydrogenase
LADRAIEIEAQKVLVYQTIWKMSKGQVPFYEPARDKVFNDYIFERLSMTGLEILGLYSQMDPQSEDEKWKKLKGSFETMYWLFPGMSIAGGTDEIQKNIIAMFGLELPKS